MTTLITGVPGWLGSTLLARLRSDGREIRALVHSAQPPTEVAKLNAQGVHTVVGDILVPHSLEAAFDGVTRVFHLAGELHPKSAAYMEKVHADGTANIAGAAANAGVERFIYVSSISVHGYNQNGTDEFVESSPLVAHTAYARGKIGGEAIVQSLASRGELPAAILRPGPFYGPGPSRGMKLLMTLAQRAPMAVFDGGSHLRSLVHIENVVDALLLAEAAEICDGTPFLIGDATPYTVKELLASIADVTNTRVATVSLPPWLARLGGQFADVMEHYADMHLSLPTMVSQFGRHSFCSIEKAKSELNYEPKRNLSEGLREALTTE